MHLFDGGNTEDCLVLYCTVLYCTVLCFALLCSTILYCVVLNQTSKYDLYYTVYILYGTSCS